MKKYQIIYADPAWSYNDKMQMKGTHGMIRGAESFYKTMSVEDIKAMPVESISDNSSILFLWVTMPLLQEGLDVIRAWGFKYKTCGFVWVKRTEDGKIHCGMGHYTRGNAELCLIGTRGKLKRLNASISQIVESKIREHSKKPDIVRKLIVDLFGDLPRVELFARGDKSRDLYDFNRFDGWDVWGNQVEGTIELGKPPKVYEHTKDI